MVRGDVASFVSNLSSEGRWQSVASYDEAYSHIVDKVTAAFGERTINCAVESVVIVRSNREVHDVSRRVRARLRELGHLGADEIRLHAATPMGQSVRIRLSAGDHIRFLRRNDDCGVFNGTLARVEEIRFGGDHVVEQLAVRLLDKSDRVVAFGLKDMMDLLGRVLIAPAYVSTVYGLQGATVDETIVLKTAKFTYRELYVAASRARHRCLIIDVDHSMTEMLDAGDKVRALAMRSRRLTVLKRRKKPKPLAGC